MKCLSVLKLDSRVKNRDVILVAVYLNLPNIDDIYFPLEFFLGGYWELNPGMLNH